MSAKVMPAKAIVASRAPPQSSLWLMPSLRLSGTRKTVMARIATAIGTLMKNTHRQEA